MSVPAEQFFAVEPKPVKEGNVLTANEFFGGSDPSVFNSDDEGEKLGFAQRFQEDIDKRVEMSREIVDAVQNGEQSTAEGVLQVAGKVGVGAILDFIGEAVVSGGRGLSAITPDIIEKPLIDGATAAGHQFLNTDVGQTGLNAALQGVDAYKQFRAENPRAARNIEAVVNIGLLLFPAKAKPAKPSSPTITGTAGEKLAASAANQAARTRKQFVDDLILPKQTQSVLTEQVSRTAEKGILRSKVVELSPQQQAIADTVAKIPGVSSKKTLQGNHTAIAKELAKEAEGLKKSAGCERHSDIS